VKAKKGSRKIEFRQRDLIAKKANTVCSKRWPYVQKFSGARLLSSKLRRDSFNGFGRMKNPHRRRARHCVSRSLRNQTPSSFPRRRGKTNPRRADGKKPVRLKIRRIHPRARRVTTRRRFLENRGTRVLFRAKQFLKSSQSHRKRSGRPQNPPPKRARRRIFPAWRTFFKCKNKLFARMTRNKGENFPRPRF